jgi:hypothetical protein
MSMGRGFGKRESAKPTNIDVIPEPFAACREWNPESALIEQKQIPGSALRAAPE